MATLESYLEGKWISGEGDDIALENPANGETVASVRKVEDLRPGLAWGRAQGGPALRKMTFGERAEMLSRISKMMQDHREEFIALAMANGGNTRKDAKFDIDGATAVLATYAELGKELGDVKWVREDAATPLMTGGKLRVQHVRLPKHGVAVHINAFNFPAWGFIGKAAVAWLAGMPVLCKPATSTAVVAHRIAQLIIENELVPSGALQLLLGGASNLLDALEDQDVVAFTGSASTGMKIRGHENVIAKSVRVNIEADSLNAAVIGPDVEEGSELFDLVIRDCATEMTQKAGQKCTATRRILVPESVLEAVRERLVERLDEIAERTGDPTDKSTRMGPLTSKRQLDDGRAGVKALAAAAKIVRGSPERKKFSGVEADQGYFLEPILLEADSSSAKDPGAAFHHTEVFGPVATLLPYDGSAQSAAAILSHGRGSLVSTVYSDDREFLAESIYEMGPFLGRLVVAGEKIAQASFSPGLVFPLVNHGGPGRAGSGEELGGQLGLSLYTQRTAVQGGAGQLARLLGK